MTSRLDELLAVLSNSPTWAAMRSTCSAWACSSALAIARFPLLHDLEMVGPVVEAGGGPSVPEGESTLSVLDESYCGATDLLPCMNVCISSGVRRPSLLVSIALKMRS
jgi:hypothetical protein